MKGFKEEFLDHSTVALKQQTHHRVGTKNVSSSKNCKQKSFIRQRQLKVGDWLITEMNKHKWVMQ